MRKVLMVSLLGGLMAGCSAEKAASPDITAASTGSSGSPPASLTVAAKGASTVAGFADRGSLASYDNQHVVSRGGLDWHPVQLSERYAMRSIADGAMLIHAPNGEPIKLRYERHIEHADGNWTWIGRPAGATKGVEAIITFGKDAVFGSIPYGKSDALQLTTVGGRTWMVQSNGRAPASMTSASDSDYLTPTPAAAIRATQGPMRAAAQKHQIVASAAGSASDPAPASYTVDLVMGYTTAFATRLGGQSQAATRLNYMVDIANQAYANSLATVRVRLVHSVQVDYPDATANRAALFELTGVQCTTAPSSNLHLPDRDVTCTPAATPAALAPLVRAREQYGADLVSLVRIYNVPENQSCGVAWIIGGGQQVFGTDAAAYGVSVISDTSGSQFPDSGNTCSDQTLAHELGHNMGLVHDRASAAGGDDSDGDGNPLDPGEYGRFPYSFGYNTDASAGNFYTVMSLRSGNQQSIRVFSNPRISTCNGFPCGLAGEADNVRTLEQTIPIVAAFRASTFQGTGLWLRGDFDGDGNSDILWRNYRSGNNVIWRSADSSTAIPVARVATPQGWVVVGASDFDGDGKADLLWRNVANGANVIWKSGNAATPQAVARVPSQYWIVAGAGDFDGDGKSDILWRNLVSGANVVWRSGNSGTAMAVTRVVGQAWLVAGIGDFDGDHKADILWRNTSTGANVIWKSANASTSQAVASVTDQAWTIAGAADFNGDGKSDIFWRNTVTGQNIIWKSGNGSTPQAVSGVTPNGWLVVGLGDFDGDLKADVLWRSTNSGANVIWKSANSATSQAVSPVAQPWAPAA